MNLYLLKLKDSPANPRWDYYSGHVVRAETSWKARRECPQGDEGDAWTDTDRVTVKRLASNVKGGEGVVLSSFHAG